MAHFFPINEAFPSKPIKRTSRFDTVFSLALLGAMLAVAIIVTVVLQSSGSPLVFSVMIGASVGVLGVWFVVRYTWMAAMCISRGAPFRPGDRVEVTSGQHRGEIGEVIDRLPDRCAVRVTLVDETGRGIVRVFDWNEVRRTTNANNVT